VNPPLFLHVFSTFAPGGPEVRAVQIINELGQKFQHMIISIDGRYSAASRLQPAIQYKLLTVRSRGQGTLQSDGRRFIESALTLAAEAVLIGRYIRQYQPALVLAYNFGAIGAAIYIRLMGRTPLIHFEDGFGLDELFHRKTRRKLIRKLVLPAAYRVVVPTNSLRELLVKECKLPRDLVYCIPNGVNTRAFGPLEPSETRNALGLPSNSVSFGTVCHLRPEKRLDVLLKAFHEANLPGAILLIVGDGPCREDLMRLARRLGVQEKVFWTGEVVASSLHYGAMDAFVCSSDTEQMPLAMLEAMSSAVPVISTNVGECHRVLSGCPSELLVPCGDSQSLAAAMRWIYANRQLWKYLGDQNRTRCTIYHDQGIMVERHVNLYHEAMGLSDCCHKPQNERKELT
jgi:glycosyltransferase involved in cell wall biosynthesis